MQMIRQNDDRIDHERSHRMYRPERGTKIINAFDEESVI
jgi:hypothetical protein